MRAVLLSAVMAAAAISGPAFAKLPPPSDEAKAKAAEAAAKAAFADKVAAYKTCQLEDRLVEAYRAHAKSAGKEAPAPVGSTACVDPGPTPPAEKSLETSGAHSPPGAATSPPSTKPTSAELDGAPKK